MPARLFLGGGVITIIEVSQGVKERVGKNIPVSSTERPGLTQRRVREGRKGAKSCGLVKRAWRNFASRPLLRV